MWVGINKTIEYFRNEIGRKRHSERNVWIPDVLKAREGEVPEFDKSQ